MAATDHPATDKTPPPWRGIRESAGLTAETLAHRFGVSASTVRRFERDPDLLGKLAKAKLELLYSDLRRETATRRGDAPTTPATVAHVAT